MNFNGLGINMGNLYRLSDAKTRSISPENYSGEKGKGGMCELKNGFAKNAARDASLVSADGSHVVGSQIQIRSDRHDRAFGSIQ